VSSFPSYTLALKEAEGYEEQRKSDTIVGGSSHGVIEIIYRIHATRLKVLLAAVKRPKEYRNAAEAEALQITESYWFEQPEKSGVDAETECLRARIWNVLADVVGCMAYCRREQPYFHRSVYRQAQALMLAPLFDNPDSAVKDGSLAFVSASKSYKLRGLNSGPCANSAESIIKLLFDKKRPQLVSVWYSNSSSPSPFVHLNDTTRKYDTLRCKYIGAFIDCMRLCNRKATLATLINNLSWSRRDLVSFYSASAMAKGGTPEQSHNRDNLLLPGGGLIHFAMRRANAALSAIAQLGAYKMAFCERTEELKHSTFKELECAYECFLRLNCPINDGIWQSQEVRRNLIDGRIIEIEALCDTYGILIDPNYASLSNQWNGGKMEPWEVKFRRLQLTIRKCIKMFPSITQQYMHTKRRRKKKNITGYDGVSPFQREELNLKNKFPGESNDDSCKSVDKLAKTKGDDNKDLVTRRIIVKVPEDSKEGECLYIIATCGSLFQRKLHLTIPQGKPSKLKFQIKVPSKTQQIEVKVKKTKKRKLDGPDNGDKKKEHKISH